MPGLRMTLPQPLAQHGDFEKNTGTTSDKPTLQIRFDLTHYVYVTSPQSTLTGQLCVKTDWNWHSLYAMSTC